jgi:hypothetical protein
MLKGRGVKKKGLAKENGMSKGRGMLKGRGMDKEWWELVSLIVIPCQLCVVVGPCHLVINRTCHCVVVTWWFCCCIVVLGGVVIEWWCH